MCLYSAASMLVRRLSAAAHRGFWVVSIIVVSYVTWAIASPATLMESCCRIKVDLPASCQPLGGLPGRSVLSVLRNGSIPIVAQVSQRLKAQASRLPIHQTKPLGHEGQRNLGEGIMCGSQSREDATVHTFGLFALRIQNADTPTKAPPDSVCPSCQPIIGAFALTGVGQHHMVVMNPNLDVANRLLVDRPLPPERSPGLE